ncbi:hypothetical protein MMC12_001420 [Toensbergia leucococca]|nr:hypothetical protein [Toensbergia leucococca]
MWILQSDGNALDSKSIQTQTFEIGIQKVGLNPIFQTEGCGYDLEENICLAEHRNLLSEQEVNSLVNSRTEITLEDEQTKHGTDVDGEKVAKGGKKVLKGDEHTFQLGTSKEVFRIKWQPVVLSFSFSSKETKGGKDPLIPVRGRLEDLDIKAIIPYIIGKTTHVVAGKRNTAKGLQALINAKYIVTEAFVDALVYVTTPGNLDELESLSPLEEDFDANWPDPLQYLPGQSKEPSLRPTEFFEPKPQRNNVFDGYTFVFCDQTQFEALHLPIANGGGKALQFNLEDGKTSADEVVRFVKNAAGEKGLGEFEDGSEGKGVVVVRFRGGKGFIDWATRVAEEVAQTLDQRLIEQSEFLDAILLNDASALRRQLPEAEEESVTAHGPSAALSQNHCAGQEEQQSVVDEPAQPEDSQPPPRRVRPRGTIVSRFKGFDDGFGESANITPSHNIDLSLFNSEHNRGASQYDSNHVSFGDSAMEVDSQGIENSMTQTQNPRKRRSPPSEEENDDEMVDQLLPAAAAMKRRRIEEDKESQQRGKTNEASLSRLQKPAETAKKRKPKKEVNIQETVRERREAEENAARRDEESLKGNLDGMTVEQMKNLVVVEDMEFPERKDRPQRMGRDAHASSRWDERWNGRKNFKKFQRRGEGTAVRRGQSVIVPLEEVKKKDFGVGEAYWLESEKSKRKRKENDQATQSQSQPFATARSQAAEVPKGLTDMEGPELVDIEEPRTTRRMDRTNRLEEGSTRSQVANRKRPALASTGGRAAKKQKTLVARESESESESESEDDMRFRFKKRR